MKHILILSLLSRNLRSSSTAFLSHSRPLHIIHGTVALSVVRTYLSHHLAAAPACLASRSYITLGGQGGHPLPSHLTAHRIGFFPPPPSSPPLYTIHLLSHSSHRIHSRAKRTVPAGPRGPTTWLAHSLTRSLMRSLVTALTHSICFCSNRCSAGYNWFRPIYW
ncbi:hypothetical protein QBC32DRAFT_5097 [Pseudoneurospora amorphoporcata]|uniref:Uncharacterized protein n=1 Tax=Pseudoneurospora amorphoporcata TaxID=241081 RepID=A0AAN6SFD8_9PEZI|nr:hypothetical protein QBC32DRAFT_5097 [Pseudoneurospora amorphoporcata]